MKSFEQELGLVYSSLSDKLRQAADFVVANPFDVASRSLRAIASDAELAPVTFTRMARAVGYDDYDALREEMRVAVARRSDALSAGAFSQGVERLQSEHEAGRNSFLSNHQEACIRNLGLLGAEIDEAEIKHVVEVLHRSRRVLISGALGSTGMAEYMAYNAHFIADNWALAGRMGASMGGGLVGLDERDVLIVITKPPFASNSLLAAEMARAQGVFVIVITDTHTCPALRHGSARFIVPTQSPHFFSSYVGTLMLIESIIGLLAARAGPEARVRIAEVEKFNRRFEEVCDG